MPSLVCVDNAGARTTPLHCDTCNYRSSLVATSANKAHDRLFLGISVSTYMKVRPLCADNFCAVLASCNAFIRILCPYVMSVICLRRRSLNPLWGFTFTKINCITVWSMTFWPSPPSSHFSFDFNFLKVLFFAFNPWELCIQVWKTTTTTMTTTTTNNNNNNTNKIAF